MTAEIFNIQRFSLYDGPGVRTVVFLKGCPLRCKWCHNPEGLSPKKQIRYNPDRCMGCGACAAVCPNHKMVEGKHLFDRSACTACGKCTEECYSLALTPVSQTQSVEEVLETVLLDKENYAASGGGLTLSGGEPLMHGDFTLELLTQAKAHGIHTCMETSGFGKKEILEQAAKVCDLFLFDYKATGDELHKKLCGVPQTPILENLQLLDSLGVKVILRCPLIPELNGTDAHLQGIAQTANKFSCVQQVQLEPYHRLGISKSHQLGLTPDYEAQVPETAWTENFREELQKLCHVPVRVM